MTQDFEQSLNNSNKTNGNKKLVSSSGSSSKTQTQNSSNSSRNEKKDKSREALQTRIVIRHLPPTMTEEQFLSEISPIPEYNDFYFVRADPTLGVYSFCRAYFNFLHMEDVFIFKDKFDNYVFVDSKGNEYAAIVEFASFQKVLRRRIGANGQPITAKKRDNKCGTIEQDADYIAFLENLEKSKTESNLPSAEIFLEEIEAREKEMRANHGVLKVVTPLIEFIKNRKAEKLRLREERREERRNQQRIREEEHQRKIKLQLKKSEETKKQKETEEKERPTKTEDKFGQNKREKDRDKTDNIKKVDAKKTDPKKSERSDKTDRNDRRSSFGNRFKSEKPKDNSSNSESTFVVKVLQNPEKLTENINTDIASKSELNAKISEKPETAEPKKISETKSDKKDTNSKFKSESSSKSEKLDSKNRIRNKDRPTREIYRPGAVKRPTTTNASEGQQTASNSGCVQKGSTNRSEHGYKNRVFTRSKHTD